MKKVFQYFLFILLVILSIPVLLVLGAIGFASFFVVCIFVATSYFIDQIITGLTNFYYHLTDRDYMIIETEKVEEAKEEND